MTKYSWGEWMKISLYIITPKIIKLAWWDHSSQSSKDRGFVWTLPKSVEVVKNAEMEPDFVWLGASLRFTLCTLSFCHSSNTQLASHLERGGPSTFILMSWSRVSSPRQVRRFTLISLSCDSTRSKCPLDIGRQKVAQQDLNRSSTG